MTRKNTSTIATGGFQESSIAAFISFPSIAYALEHRQLANLRTCALLRLDNGSFWVLNAAGCLWTHKRLLLVQPILTALSEEGGKWSLAEQALKQKLSIPSLTLIPYVSRLQIAQQWAASVGKMTERLLAKEEAVLCRFIDAMDPEIATLATIQDDQIDLRLYNYLAHDKYKQARLDAFRTLPLFIPGLLEISPSSEGAELRAVIDQRKPVVKYLASSWGFSPVVIRTIIRTQPEEIGRRWTSRLHHLATVLATLPAEYLPKSAEDWVSFDIAVNQAEKYVEAPIWDSPLTLSCLRYIIVNSKEDQERTAENQQIKKKFTELKYFRQALIEFLLFRVQVTRTKQLNPAESTYVSRIVQTIADQFLVSGGTVKNLKLARLFMQRFEQALQRAEKHNFSTVPGRFQPMIPYPFRSEKWNRIVAPLCSSSELRRQGAALSICLANDKINERYSQQCLSGNVFILSVNDATTGLPVSTVHIAASFSRTRYLPGWKLQVVQHTSMRNTQPSKQCEKTVSDLLTWCKTPEVQDHLYKRYDPKLKRKKFVKEIMIGKVLTRILDKGAIKILCNKLPQRFMELN